MTHQTSILWLKISTLTLVILGALFSWTTVGPLSAINLFFADIIIWPLDGLQNYTAIETRLLAAITGGLTSGFAISIYMMTRYVYEHDQQLGGRMILTTVFTWFIVDNIGSYIAGVPENIFANLSFIIMLALPVLLSSNWRQTAHT